MALLAELNEQGTTICMVTHDPRYAGYAKKQVKLLDGKVLNSGKESVSAVDVTTQLEAHA